jgi:hypothetical protein
VQRQRSGHAHRDAYGCRHLAISNGHRLAIACCQPVGTGEEADDQAGNWQPSSDSPIRTWANACRYLAGEGLIEEAMPDMGGSPVPYWVNIRHEGIREIEQSLQRPTSRPSTSLRSP